MESNPIIKENGFYFKNITSYFWVTTKRYLISIYFINDFMVFEMDSVPGKININEHLFKAKYKNKLQFVKYINDNKYIPSYTPLTKMGTVLSKFELENGKITAHYLGNENLGCNDLQVCLYKNWLGNTKIDILFDVALHQIEFLKDRNNKFLIGEKIDFYTYNETLGNIQEPLNSTTKEVLSKTDGNYRETSKQEKLSQETEQNKNDAEKYFQSGKSKNDW